MIELNKIYNEDCLEGMKRIPDGSVDMILCDLPYGTTQNKWDVIIPFDKLWGQYERIIKDNGAIVLTGQQPFSSKLIMSNFKLFRYEWIWEKEQGTGHLNAKKALTEIAGGHTVEDAIFNHQLIASKALAAIGGDDE